MLSEKIASLFKKPKGFFGVIMAKMMDVGNVKAINWTYSLLDVKDNENILEIGYGSGILVKKLAESGKNIRVFGIDFSDLMFKRANVKNKKFIEDGLVKLSCGDILEYKEKEVLFDKIIAINVIYFWNDLNLYLKKLYGMLKKNGELYFYMIAPEELQKLKFTRNEIFNKYTPEDIQKELKKLKFKKIEVKSGKTNVKKAHCIIAKK